MTASQPRAELWLVDLAASGPALASIERKTPRLGAAERARAEEPADPRQRNERLAAHVALRVLIERVAGRAIRGRTLVRGPAGKPHLAGGGAELSLSHTAGFALIGVSATLAIGVDLERTRPLGFSPRRRDEIAASGTGLGGRPLPEADGEQAVLQAWVRIEAFSKARGATLAQTLADLGLRGPEHGRAPLPDLQAAACRLAARAGLAVHDLSLPAGLQGAVALPIGAEAPQPARLPADRASIEALLAGLP
jgi:4'-phosphopantetheinyl transferase